MRGRGSGGQAGGARITAILVSAALHLAVAAFVFGGRTDTPPVPALHTAAITLLPPVAEPHQVVTPAPTRTTPPARSAGPPTAPPEIAVPSPPAVLPPAPPAVQTITPPPRPETPPPSNADAVRDDYARQLWRWIAARRPQGLRLDGEAVVAFSVTRSGALSDIQLVQRSGSTSLDRLALRTVRLSAPVPPPPEALPDDALRFTLTFHFR
ncbi:MAG: energy transducer TonB [Pseudomonadota bacterium]|jgi:protein TonB|nr:energy transducer TonB [Pseudomonadota bacterium]